MNLTKKYLQFKNSVPSYVLILFACKYATDNQLSQLLAAKDILFGENYVQQAQKRTVKIPRNSYHFIGALQRNKVRDAIKLFGTIQTVDSIKLAKKISEVAKEENLSVNLYIQVDVDKNPNQSGVTIEEVPELIAFIRSLENVKLVGLMTLGVQGPNKREAFSSVKLLADKYKLKTSFGMSEDYKIAIEEGSNMIRLGRILLK